MAATTTTAAGASAALTDAQVQAAEPDDLKVGELQPGSGAIVEREVIDRVDLAHPAVDSNPRAGTTVGQNKIDFNDPSVPGHVQVARNLGLDEDYDSDEKREAADAAAEKASKKS